MEFDEHDNQEEEEEEEHDEEEMGIAVPPMAYESLNNSAPRVSKMSPNPGEDAGVPNRKGNRFVKYRECLKNHAVSIGGHSVDGCGEFMAAGEEGTLDALQCAACTCHRNFHRKEIDGEGSPFQQQQQHYHLHQQQLPPYYYRTPPPASGGYLQHHYHLQYPMGTHPFPQQRPLALPAAAASGGGGQSREEADDMSNPSSSGGGGGSGSRMKRFRTKFTQEQKEKMLAFAERLGWRIQKHDDAAVEQFCAETGVKRRVFKVWMHNNKHSLGKKP